MKTALFRGRAAPLIALLVIISGLITIFALTTRPRNVLPTPTNIPTTNLPDIPNTGYEFNRARGEYSAALYHIEARAAQNGWNAQDHIRAGNLWRDMGSDRRALPHWEAANTLEANPNLLRQIAELYIQQGEWGTAWTRIQQLLVIAPNDAWAAYTGGLLLAPSDPRQAYLYLARVRDVERDYATIANAVLDAIGDNPDNREIAMRVGAVLANAGEWSLAENAYQYAADVYFPFPEATAYAGLMRAQQGKNGDNWLAAATALAPDNGTVRYIEGAYWRVVGQFARSETALTLAILLDPVTAVYYAELGNTYQAMGNLLEAEIWLQTAALIAPDNAAISDALTSFYEQENNTIPAEYQAFSRNIDRDDPAALSANGWVQHVLGNSDEGLQTVEAALARDPDNPRGLFDKARILVETGRFEEAQPILQRIVEEEMPFADAAARLLSQ